MLLNRRYITFVALAFACIAAARVAVVHADPLEIGSPAPAFKLPGVDGKTYSLDSFRDADILVVVFTCNHCPTAQAYEGRIQQLAADFKDKKFALVAISPNDPKALRLDELGYSDLGDSFDELKTREGKELPIPLPLRWRQSKGLAGLWPGRHAARFHLRPPPKAPLSGPDRQLRKARAGHFPRHSQCH